MKSHEGTYQIETKLNLIKNKFNPQDGWQVIVDIDPMEEGKGRFNTPEKKEIAQRCIEEINKLGVEIGRHPVYNRVDVFARKGYFENYLIEVEGYSSRQMDIAIYSALGQLITQMDKDRKDFKYCIAVPDTPNWEEYLQRIPIRIRDLLNMELFLVSQNDVRKL